MESTFRPDDFGARVIKVIANQDPKMDQCNITLAMSLRDDLKFDSFGAVTLMFALEEEFDVDISDDDIRDLKTVGDVITRLHKLCGASATAP